MSMSVPHPWDGSNPTAWESSEDDHRGEKPASAKPVLSNPAPQEKGYEQLGLENTLSALEMCPAGEGFGEAL